MEKVHTPRPHWKTQHEKLRYYNIPSPPDTKEILEAFFTESYLDEAQDTELKKSNHKLIQRIWGIKEYTNK